MSNSSDAPRTSGSAATAVSAELVIHGLRSTAAHVDRTLARALEPFDLTPAQFTALQVLEDSLANGASCSDLRSHLAGVAPDVTRLLDRLVAAALVSRERDGADRRVVHTRISEKGREVLARARPAVREAHEHLLNGLSDDDRETLHGLLAGIQSKCPGN